MHREVLALQRGACADEGGRLVGGGLAFAFVRIGEFPRFTERNMDTADDDAACVLQFGHDADLFADVFGRAGSAARVFDALQFGAFQAFKPFCLQGDFVGNGCCILVHGGFLIMVKRD